MSNTQLIDNNYSIVNNSQFRYTNSQGFYTDSKVKLPYTEQVKIEQRNYKHKLLAHRSFNDSNFLPVNEKVFPYKAEPLILKENEIQELNAYDLAEIHSRKAEKRKESKRAILENKCEVIQTAILERTQKKFIMEEKEKIDLEHDIITIIADALKFSKKNTPIKGMMSSDINEKLLQLSKERRVTSKSSKSNKSLNKSIGSLINISNLSGLTKYDSNRFLKALGIDVLNLTPDNISINIDNALEQISKWRLVDKSKIKNLIRMRVINEISSVEERRSVQRINSINKKYNEYKLNLKQMREKLRAERHKNRNSSKNLSNISSIDNKDHSKDMSRTNELVHTQLGRDKDKSNINETNTMQKSTTIKTYLDDLSRFGKQYKGIKGKGKHYDIQIEKKSEKPKKRKIMLNAYNNAEKLLKIVYSNPNIKENTNVIRHFENIYNYKAADAMINKIIFRNRIVSNLGENIEKSINSTGIKQ